MRRKPQDEQAFRVRRSVALVVILTGASLYAIDRDVSRPHGNPLLYAVAMSWLISIAIAVLTSAFFFRADPGLFALARWERQGELYEGTGVRAFRWVLLRSPLGWINPNFHLTASRTDCDRLLRETNTSEGVHWLTCAVSVALAISYLVDGHAAYGYAMLLVRIPFDLYPIVLQRWNRGRVCRLLSRQVPTNA